MILAAVLLMQGLQGSPQVQAPDDVPIVIVAKQLSDAKRALDNCIARGCPPDREMKRALAYANQQFLAGNYEDARQTIAASRRRNDRYAERFPLQVSDLARASSFMSDLGGQPLVATVDARAATDALKAGLDSDDPLILMQRLEVGDRMIVNDGSDPFNRVEEATHIYDDVARAAHKSGNLLVEGHALYRKAVLLSTVATAQTLFAGSARQAVEAIQQRTEPELEPFRTAIAVVSARLAARSGKADDVRVAMAGVPTMPVGQPVLVYEPFIDLTLPGFSSSTTGSLKSEWADVSFWVKPDGTVEDVELKAQSDNHPGGWLPAKLKAIAGRRYAPMAMPSGSPGLYRVERYSMVYNRSAATGSHVATRAAVGRINAIDISSTYRGREVAIR